MDYYNNRKNQMHRRFYYLKMWFLVITIFSILVLLFQIIFNYDKYGPLSYRNELNEEINEVFKYIRPEKTLNLFKDSDFKF